MSIEQLACKTETRTPDVDRLRDRLAVFAVFAGSVVLTAVLIPVAITAEAVDQARNKIRSARNESL